MKFGWRIILTVIVVIAAVAVIFVGLNKKTKPGEQAKGSLKTTPSIEAINLPKATGNIDDVINSLMLGADAEASSIYSDSTDVSAVSYDNTEISNFGQSYENNF